MGNAWTTYVVPFGSVRHVTAYRDLFRIAPATKASEPDGKWIVSRVLTRDVSLEIVITPFSCLRCRGSYLIGYGVALHWPHSAWRIVSMKLEQQLTTIFGEGSDIFHIPRLHYTCFSEEELTSHLSAPEDRTRWALCPTTPGTSSSTSSYLAFTGDKVNRVA